MNTLTFPAPRRASHIAANGLYTDYPWTAEDVLGARCAGAWFKPGDYHYFADMEASKLAFASLEKLVQLVQA